ncbi:MAG: glycerol-3-phosphate acyltransferase [Planctomycetes bacterium]|nr:glycerol-3-phosphate acyltransferase [Planctomycetota bacterium]
MIYGKEILVVVAGYLLGCVCTGYYLVRLCTGNDVRNSGSGGTGARNVSRTLGKSGYAVTLAADIIKGVIAVGFALLLNIERWAVVVTFLAAVIGHIWPVQLRFRGGKGVAVMLGAMMVFDYRLLIVLVAVCALLYLFTRRYIISGAVGIFTLPATAVVLKYPMSEMIGMVVLILIILFAHRANIYEVFRPRRPEAAY